MDLERMAILCRPLREAGAALGTHIAYCGDIDGALRFAIGPRVTIPYLATLALVDAVIVVLRPIAVAPAAGYAFAWTPSDGAPFPTALGRLRFAAHDDGCILIATATCHAPAGGADRRLAYRIGQATAREMLRELTARVEGATRVPA